jgi:hypothetical protein
MGCLANRGGGLGSLEGRWVIWAREYVKHRGLALEVDVQVQSCIKDRRRPARPFAHVILAQAA